MRRQCSVVGVGVAAALMLGGLQTGCHRERGTRGEARMGERVGKTTAEKVDYLQRLALFDAEQISLARLAQQKATNPQVRQLAQQMEQQYTQHLRSLQAYADGERLQLALVDLAGRGTTGMGGAGRGGMGTGGAGTSSTEDAAVQSMEREAQRQSKDFQKEVRSFAKDRDALASRTGPDFDKAFLSEAEKATKEGEKLVRDGLKKYPDDPALAAVLARAEPVLQQNRQSLEQAERSLRQSKGG